MSSTRSEKTPNQNRVFDTPNFTVTGNVIVQESLTGSTVVQGTSGSFDRMNGGRWAATGGATLPAHVVDTGSGSYFSFGVALAGTPKVFFTLTGSNYGITGSIYATGSSTTGSYLSYNGTPSIQIGVDWLAVYPGFG